MMCKCGCQTVRGKAKSESAILRWQQCVGCGYRCWDHELSIDGECRARGQLASCLFNEPHSLASLIEGSKRRRHRIVDHGDGSRRGASVAFARASRR